MDFDKQAESWDTRKRESRAKLIAKMIARETAMDPEMNGLEFGCGTGLVSFFLKDDLHQITLVDSSEKMIQVLKEKIEKTGADNMTALHGDLLSKDTLTEKYDVIYTSMALHHITALKEILSILIQHLNPWGQLCIVDLYKDDGRFHQSEADFSGHHGFDPQELGALLKELGLTDIRSKGFFGGIKKEGDEALAYALFAITGTKK